MNTDDDCGYFHVCTDGTSLAWMFKDANDFAYGINRIAVCKVLTGVIVLNFSLMDNHGHFLLYGTYTKCLKFINRYKVLTGKWISHKYKVPKYLKHLPTSIIPLKSEEDILDVASYIDRNAIMAGFKGLPSEYPWGSCQLMFKNGKDRLAKCKRIRDFSENELRDLLKTRVTMPDDWLINDEGMIMPECFTAIDTLEKLFKSPARYLYFLTKKLEGKIDLDISQSQKNFVPDMELRKTATDLALKMFGTSDIDSLRASEKIRLARRLKSEYLSSHKQLGRILHLDAKLLKGFV
ncbi:MAG: hypothetical protein IJ307_00600 [Bacteroidales bacterium]|nr:hypothetical protein [Bacteroidales bacterium]